MLVSSTQTSVESTRLPSRVRRDAKSLRPYVLLKSLRKQMASQSQTPLHQWRLTACLSVTTSRLTMQKLLTVNSANEAHRLVHDPWSEPMRLSRLVVPSPRSSEFRPNGSEAN